ncbi:MAG: hypothetical protein HRF50_02590 [Phycisphaerae bacterium]
MAVQRRLTLFLAACLICSTAARAQDEPLDPAYWAPADALAFMGVSDLNELGKRFERTAFHKALAGPATAQSTPHAAADSAAGLLGVMATLRERIAAALEVPASQLQNPFGRSAALFIVAARRDDGFELEPVFVATVRDSALMRTYYDKAVSRFRAACDEHETATAAGGRIDWFRRQTPQPPATQPSDALLRTDELAPSQSRSLAQMLGRLRRELSASDSLPSRLALGLAGERLIVAFRPETVRAVLTRSASASMAEQADYRKIGTSFARAGPVRVLVNVPELCELLARQAGDDAKTTLTMLGADGLRSLIGHLDFGGQAYDSMFEGVLLMSGERRGLARLLSMANRPAASVSDFTSAAVYLEANLAAGALVEELERMLRHVEPDAADEMAAALTLPVGDGSESIDLRHALLEALAPPVELSLTAGPAGTAASPQVLLRVALRSREGLDRLMDAISTVAPGVFVRRDTAGQAVYDVRALDASLAWSNGVLVAGTTSAVNEMSGGAAGSRSPSGPADAGRLAPFLPSEASLVLYIDGRALRNAARGAGGAQPPSTTPSQRAPALGRWIAEAIADAFGDSADAAAGQADAGAPATLTTLTTTTDGVRITSYQLKPGLN